MRRRDVGIAPYRVFWFLQTERRTKNRPEGCPPVCLYFVSLLWEFW